MTEPKRLLASSDDLAARIVRSALHDHPEADAVERVALALGIGAAGLGAVSKLAVSGTVAVKGLSAIQTVSRILSALGLAKWFGLGLLTGSIVLVGYHWTGFGVTPLAPVVEQPKPPAHGSDRTDDREQGSGGHDGDGCVFPAHQSPVPKTHAIIADAGQADGPHGSAIDASDENAHPSLSADIAILDQVRTALARGQTADAHELLQQYQSRPSTGVLEPEAQLARIEILSRKGQAAEAAALAQQFLQEHPSTSHRARLVRIVGVGRASPRHE